MFDRKQGTISLNDESFHLEHQQAKILNLLIDNKDTVISREQIAEQVWQGVIVEDNTISKAITRLRKVLNDSAKSSHIIKTIPKKGYQFIAELEVISEQSSKAIIDDEPKKIFRSSWLTLTVVLLALLASLTLFKLQQKPDAHTSVMQKVALPKPISFREGIELNAHLHADKKTLLFVGDNAEYYGIFAKNIGDANAQLLTPISVRSIYPKWLNAINKSFVFSDLDEQQQCQIFKVTSLQSTQKEAIATCLSESPVEVFVNQEQQSIAWSDNAGSWQLDLSKGNRKSLPYQNQNIHFQMPSPNGKYWAQLSVDGAKSQLTVIDTNNQRIVLEKPLAFAISHFKWSKASDALYHLGEHPANQLYQLSLNGEHTILASTSLGTMTRISDVQSPNTIEFVISSVDLDIHQINNGEESKLINSPFADYNPALSKLTNQLAFASKRTGTAQVWLQNEKGTLRQLSQFDRASFIYDIAWSPDETKLLVRRNNSIHIINVGSQKEHVLSLDAKDKVAWQWISENQIAYVDQASNSLFSIELDGQHTVLLQANIASAQYINDQWFISDSSGQRLYQFDAKFSVKKQVTDLLNSRHWIVNANKVYVVNVMNDKPISLVELVGDDNEKRIISGAFNPLSLRTTSQGGLLFHRMNRNEANIYQLHID